MDFTALGLKYATGDGNKVDGQVVMGNYFN